jgi:hypothetical protein
MLDRPVKGSARITMINPDGSEHPPIEYRIDLSEVPRARNIARSGGFSLIALGLHWFKIELKVDGEPTWREVTRFPIAVLAAT